MVTLNHLGSVSASPRQRWCHSTIPGGSSSSRPVSLVQPCSQPLADDLERTVAIGAQLVSSRAASSPERGSSPKPVHGVGKASLDAEVALEGWGRVTTLWSFGTGHDQLLAVGGEGRATLRGTRRRAARAKAARRSPPGSAWDGRLLWAAGSELATSPVDLWVRRFCRGGRYAGLDPSNGQMVIAGALPDDVAWGSGAAVVMVEEPLCAVGPQRPRQLVAKRAFRRVVACIIAHAAAVGGRVLYGFNRGDSARLGREVSKEHRA